MGQSDQLITKTELARVIGVDKPGLRWLAGVLMWLTRLNKLNSLYAETRHLEGQAFIDAVFSKLGIQYKYFEEELNRIPKEGAFITVSNHPQGGIDGLIRLKLLTHVRPDFKALANFLLSRIEPIKDALIGVNPFENHREAYSSSAGLRESLKHLSEGKALGMFPAAEVSRYNLRTGEVVDRKWQDSSIKLVIKAGVPVVPMYFKARNSLLFYFLAILSPTLQTARLPAELIRKRQKTVLVRIGKPISPGEWAHCKNADEVGALLRERTYRLAAALEDPSRLNRLRLVVARPAKEPEAIIEETPRQRIWDEIEALRQREGSHLTTFRTFEVFYAEAATIPGILREIGRLREITFRKVGEGTNMSTDLDNYDQSYHHLFLWDNAEARIVGAYRLGMGTDLFAKHGIEGFYVNTLFRIDPEAFPYFEKCLEMGRAFIIEEYQQKPMPLFLLWKGIVHVILRNPDKVRYLTGCVSISNQFSKFSKAMMIAYVQHHFYDRELGNYIRPRKEFRVRLSEEDEKYISESSAEDLNKFDRFIDEVEPGNGRFPVLLKKYIKQNAKIVCFNVDPKFNNSIDGFMYIDINHLPEQTIQPVLEELDEAARKSVRLNNG